MLRHDNVHARLPMEDTSPAKITLKTLKTVYKFLKYPTVDRIHLIRHSYDVRTSEESTEEV